MQPHEYAELKNTLAQILKEITSNQLNIRAGRLDKEPLLCEEMPIGSLEQGKIFEALSKAQAEMEPAYKETENPFYKKNYADWATVVKASRRYLTKFGISVNQSIVARENGQQYLYTQLGHASNQFIASRVKIVPQKPDPQNFGSTTTYMKRYSYNTLVGIADPYEDDDGESLMTEHREREAKKNHYPNKKGNEDDQPIEVGMETEPINRSIVLSHDQYEMINVALEAHPDPEILQNIRKAYNVQTLADLPRADFQKIMTRIQKLRRDLEK